MTSMEYAIVVVVMAIVIGFVSFLVGYYMGGHDL